MPGFQDFSISVPGKWVLAGEHSVLRGVHAIALPHPEYRLRLNFSPESEPLLRTVPTEARLLAEGLIEAVYKSVGKARTPDLRGVLRIESTIPYGAGLGSSAALCVAIVRWLSQPLGIKSREIREIATRLEDRFHGKSSGMDVAVASEGVPIQFRVSETGVQCTPLSLKRFPKFTFHDTGLRKKTSECITRVDRFRMERPKAGALCDEKMKQASELSLEGLRLYSDGRGSDGPSSADAKAYEFLEKAMQLGQECFKEWDLVPEIAQEIEQRLYSEGARGVKMTGAGGGGFLVALWD